MVLYQVDAKPTTLNVKVLIYRNTETYPDPDIPYINIHIIYTNWKSVTFITLHQHLFGQSLLIAIEISLHKYNNIRWISLNVTFFFFFIYIIFIHYIIDMPLNFYISLPFKALTVRPFIDIAVPIFICYYIEFHGLFSN